MERDRERRIGRGKGRVKAYLRALQRRWRQELRASPFGMPNLPGRVQWGRVTRWAGWRVMAAVGLMGGAGWVLFNGPPSRAIAVLPGVPLVTPGAVPNPGRWQVLALTRPFYTKGWTTVEVRGLVQLSGLKLEVELSPEMAKEAHVHVALFPLSNAPEPVNVGIPEDGFPIGRWPMDIPTTASGAAQYAQVQQAQVADWRFSGNPTVLHVFQDRVQVAPNAWEELAPPDSGDSDMAGPASTNVSDWSDFPIPPYADTPNFGPGSVPLMYATTKRVDSHVAKQRIVHTTGGEQIPPGGTVMIDVSSYVAGWEGVRVALACYHMDPVTAQEQIFQMYPTDHALTLSATVSVSEAEYRNDPFFYWYPWKFAMNQASAKANWLSHDAYFLRPLARPSMWSLFGKVNGLAAEDDFQGMEGLQMYDIFPTATALLDWDTVVGKGPAKWLLSWSGAFFNIGEWDIRQPHANRLTGMMRVNTDDNGSPIIVNNMPQFTMDFSAIKYDREVLPSHAMMAHWLHLANQALFQHLPYYSGALPEDWPASWTWMQPAGYGAWANWWPGGLSAENRQKYSTPSWYESMFSGWPAPTVPGGIAGAKWGLGTPLGRAEEDPDANSLYLWQPCLPLMFGQTRVLNSTEFWSDLFESWATVMGANKRFVKWLSPNNLWLVFKIISSQASLTSLDTWQEWMETLPGFQPTERQDRWTVDQADSALQSMFMFYYGSIPSNNRFYHWFHFYKAGSTVGMEPWVQPKYWMTTANYPLEKIKVWGLQ